MPYFFTVEDRISIQKPPACVVADTLEEMGAGLRTLGYTPVYGDGTAPPETGRRLIGIALRAGHSRGFVGFIYAQAAGSIAPHVAKGIYPGGADRPRPFPEPFHPWEEQETARP